MPPNGVNLFEMLVGLEVVSVVRFNLTRTVLLLLGTSLLITLAAHAQTTKPTSGAVQGTVLLENDSIPIPDARIFVFSETRVTSTLSDRAGKFSFSQLPPGVYSFKAMYMGLRAERSITIEAGEVVQVAL
jgi:hypothetical protein